MLRNRKRIMTAAVLLVMVFTLLVPQGIRPAQAATVINEIRLTCDPAAVGFDPANTEGQVDKKICNLAGLHSEGVKLNVLNTGLMYWVTMGGAMWGIGDGTDKIDPSKDYHFFAMIELDDSTAYDWPADIKAQQYDKYYPVTSCSVSVYLNGKKRTDAVLQRSKSSNPMNIRVYIPFGPEMASCKVKLSETAFTYDGKAHKPAVQSLTLYGKNVPKEYYSFSYVDANNKTVASPTASGKYYAVFTGKGMYQGSYKAAFMIGKPNTMKVEGKTVTVKASKLKKKNQTVKAKKAVTVKKAVGKVTYAKASGNKKITVAPNGKITIQKGLKRGKYKVKIKVTAAGNSKYLPLTKKITVTVVVK